VAKYDGRWVVLNNCKVQGDFDTMDEGIEYGREQFGPNKFLVHQVGPGKENYTITYRPRVVSPRPTNALTTQYNEASVVSYWKDS
jgi:hypothetical protein